MRILPAVVILIGVFARDWAPLRAAQQAPSSGQTSTAARTVATYCAGCHNGVMRSPSGELLDEFDPARISESPDAWTRAYRQLQAGTMPPVGAARPDRAAYDAVLASIEAGLGVTLPRADATSQEIAARLALLLWNSAPDTSLRDDAESNRLTDPQALQRQVTRMLNDDRARAFVTRFFFPWLGLDQLGRAEPDPAYFPDYDVALRDAMAQETELFLLSQLQADGDPIELWTANYTFLNEQLAAHYGIPGVTGTRFRRVALSAPERAGLLGHGSVHMVTSKHQPAAPAGAAPVRRPEGGYTSPAARAMWVRLRFLGAAAPQPFPGAQPVNPELPITPQTRTLPAEPCANCHRNFFPLGYALENFDPIGRWRTSDQAGPVDASGTFVDGTPTDGVVQLRNVLLQRPDAFRTTITENLLAYAAGRPVRPSRPTPDTLVGARQVLRGMKDVRWSRLIAAVVRVKPHYGL